MSGSGPGFFFYLIEEWIKAVQDLGFSYAQARDLILATVDGSNELLKGEYSVSELKQQVASKGGSTQAGLEVLENSNIKEVWSKVLQASKDRAEELSR